jgi:hypothetical protein
MERCAFIPEQLMAYNDSFPKSSHSRSRTMKDNGFFGGVYGMAFIGAAIYFIGHATSFWMGVLGFFKALFWPALIMYKVLELLAL